MRTYLLILITFVVTLFSCNKDKETDDLQWQFSVESANEELTGIEIGKEINLKYILKKDYNAGASIKYEIETNDSNFKLTNNAGEEVELNKSYSIEGDTLKLNYTFLSKGEKNIKILFKNSKGYQVSKELSFFVDGYGFYIVPSSTETVIRDYLELKYHYEGFDNKTENEFLVKIVEDEAEGRIIDKNGDSYSKGDSFIINTDDEDKTLKYITKNVTKNKDFDKIILEVIPKKGSSTDKKEIYIKQRFINNNFEISINFPTGYVYPNQKTDFTINVKEPFGIRRKDYTYDTKIAPYIMLEDDSVIDSFSLPIHDPNSNNYIVGKNSYFIYNGNKYKLNEKIPLKKGENVISMILDKESFVLKEPKYFNGLKKLVSPELELNVDSHPSLDDNTNNIIPENGKITHITFRHSKVWFYPEVEFVLRESYGEGKTCDLCIGDNAARNKLALLSKQTSEAKIHNAIDNNYKLNIKSVDIDAANNRENKVNTTINIEDLPIGHLLGYNDLNSGNKGNRRFAGLYEFTILYQDKAVVTGNFYVPWGNNGEVVDVYVNSKNQSIVKNLKYIDFNK